MHPLEQLAKDYDTNLNRLSLDSGLCRTTLRTKVERDRPIESMQLSSFLAIAPQLNLTPGELVDKLLTMRSATV